MAKVETGINWQAVRSELDREAWEVDRDNDDIETRTIYLGSVLSLYPSGKYYMPFACSNLDACDTCSGTGKAPHRHKRRSVKKWKNAYDRNSAKWQRTHGDGLRPCDNAYLHYCLRHMYADDCAACGGVGSREAYLDELYREKLESEADAHGLCITGSEGDGLDVLIAEYRDIDTSNDE